MFLESQNAAGRDISQGLLKIGFGPRQVVDLLRRRALSDPLIDKLTGRMFHRREITARDMGVYPGALFGGEGDGHGHQTTMKFGVVRNTISFSRASSWSVSPPAKSVH